MGSRCRGPQERQFGNGQRTSRMDRLVRVSTRPSSSVLWIGPRRGSPRVAIGDEPNFRLSPTKAAGGRRRVRFVAIAAFICANHRWGAGPGEPNDDRLRRKQPRNRAFRFRKKNSCCDCDRGLGTLVEVACCVATRLRGRTVQKQRMKGLLLSSETWYLWKMNDSWIAIVDRRGLRLLVLETSHALPFLLRRASRQNAECFWAVLEPRHAVFIEHLRRTGSPNSALRWLEYLATDLGRVAPCDSSDPPWISEDVTIPHDRDREWNY